MGVIKWSDLFASLLGEKDTVTIGDTTPPTQANPETAASLPSSPTTTAASTAANQTSPAANAEFNTAERDALLSEIAKLRAANQQLVMQGTLAPNNDISSKSDTELIYNLCAGRSKDGRTFNNDSTAASAGV